MSESCSREAWSDGADYKPIPQAGQCPSSSVDYKRMIELSAKVSVRKEIRLPRVLASISIAIERDVVLAEAHTCERSAWIHVDHHATVDNERRG